MIVFGKKIFNIGGNTVITELNRRNMPQSRKGRGFSAKNGKQTFSKTKTDSNQKLQFGSFVPPIKK